MTPDHAAFADWDAGYVLGALTPADRRAYEMHLEECERCRDAVAELASMPGLLSRARPVVEAFDEQPLLVGPPPDMVHRVTRRRQRQRTIRTRIVLGVTAVAAAVAIAIAVPLAIVRPPAPAVSVALAAVEESTMTAKVGLTDVAWGTRISMECDYPAGESWGGQDGPWSYTLVVIDEEGRSSQLSTWNAVPGKAIQLDAGTALALDEIASVEVRSGAGETILAGSVDE